MTLETDLLEIEKALWEGGPETYRAHCDETCLVVFAEMAGPMSRDDIAAQAEAGRWTQVKLEPKGFVRLQDGCAVTAYACSAMNKDGKPHKALVSSTYVERDDGWKLAAHQQTVLAG